MKNKQWIPYLISTVFVPIDEQREFTKSLKSNLLWTNKKNNLNKIFSTLLLMIENIYACSIL